VIKNIIKKILHFQDLKLSRVSTFEQETAFEAQARLLKQSGNEPFTIFDVGAFIGTVALKYRDLFPDSIIFCFEPFLESYHQLQVNIANHPNIKAIPKALGAYNERTKIYANNQASTNSLLASDERSSEIWGKGLLETQKKADIDMITLDHFITQNNIPQIDVLKLDVQGAEFLVLQGAEKALKAGKINIIYTEIITLPTYENQKSLGENIQMFLDYGFELFSFYNYDRSSTGQVRQMDAIFVRKP